MRRSFGGFRLSKVNTTLLVAGAVLLLVAGLARWVTIGSNQILPGAPWWVRVVLGATGLLAIALAMATSQEPARGLRTDQGFLGAAPKMPGADRLVERPDLSQAVVAALCAGGRPVALTGIGGAGKSTLAASACWDRRVRRRFRNREKTWLEAGPGQDRSSGTCHVNGQVALSNSTAVTRLNSAAVISVADVDAPSLNTTTSQTMQLFAAWNATAAGQTMTTYRTRFT